MSNWRKGRYGWTKAEWLSYKGWALLYAVTAHDAARQRAIRQELLALGGWHINED